MKYAIKNTSGQWWTGECWGVKQARVEYLKDLDIPAVIDVDNLQGRVSSDYLEIFEGEDPADHLYFRHNYGGRAYAEGAVASVKAVREAGDPV